MLELVELRCLAVKPIFKQGAARALRLGAIGIMIWARTKATRKRYMKARTLER